MHFARETAVMALTPSTMLQLGTPAANFRLPDTEGRLLSLEDFKDAPALLVVFMCNHCPYVKHIRSGLAAFAREFQPKGLAIVGINANDAAKYPDDSPEKMVDEVVMSGYTFPYLYDETQGTAKAYHAACTPDFFLFDKDRKLIYRGQFDDSRPGNNIPLTGKDLRDAVFAVLAGKPLSQEQKPSIGCNIKWKSNNSPDIS
jgi:peroxiredoxin